MTDTIGTAWWLFPAFAVVAALNAIVFTFFLWRFIARRQPLCLAIALQSLLWVGGLAREGRMLSNRFAGAFFLTAGAVSLFQVIAIVRSLQTPEGYTRK